MLKKLMEIVDREHRLVSVNPEHVVSVEPLLRNSRAADDAGFESPPQGGRHPVKGASYVRRPDSPGLVVCGSVEVVTDYLNGRHRHETMAEKTELMNQLGFKALDTLDVFRFFPPGEDG